MEKDTVQKQTKIGIFTKVKNLFFKSRTRTVIIVISILAVSFFAWRTFGQKKRQTQYLTAQTQKGSIISTVNESGNVTSTSQGGVGSPTTGIIKAMYVKDGDTVSQGQNLFQVKSIATAQEIAS